MDYTGQCDTVDMFTNTARIRVQTVVILAQELYLNLYMS